MGRRVGGKRWGVKQTEFLAAVKHKKGDCHHFFFFFQRRFLRIIWQEILASRIPSNPYAPTLFYPYCLPQSFGAGDTNFSSCLSPAHL